MTIPDMKRATALLVVVAALLAACGDEGDTSAARDELAGVVATADEAAEGVATLTTRVDDLTSELDDLRSAGEDASERLKALRKKLNDALADLRASLKEATRAGDGAAASAASAAARAAELARELTVLEDRFNFHLKSDH